MEELDEKRKKKRKSKKSKRKKSSGKKDACYYKVKARYSVWPSAYASGALSKCRKVGAKNWGNKSKKTNENIEIGEDLLKEMIREFLKEEKDDFKPHPMYDPKTGKRTDTKKPEDHVNLDKKGHTHVDPKILIKVLKDEGGAAGMEPFVKATKASEEEIEKTLKRMPKVGQHEDGDYILGDEKEIRVVNKIKEAILKEIADTLDEKKKKKKRKKAGSESSKESSLRDWFKRKGAKGKKGGWVDCNAPDGKGGYKACGRQKGEKRSKYPACRPTPSACRERGRGKSWGKKSAKGKKG